MARISAWSVGSLLRWIWFAASASTCPSLTSTAAKGRPPPAMFSRARARARRIWVSTSDMPSPANRKPRRSGVSIGIATRVYSVALLLLQVLPALLRIDRALGGETGLQPVQADLFARIHAVAIITGFQALERAVDLADQLAIAITRTQFQRVLGFTGRTLGLIADIAYFLAQVLDGLLGLFDQIGAPLLQPLAEILLLQRIHIFLIGRRLVALRQDRATGGFVDLVFHHLVLAARSRCVRTRGDRHGDFPDRTDRSRGGGFGGRLRGGLHG